MTSSSDDLRAPSRAYTEIDLRKLLGPAKQRWEAVAAVMLAGGAAGLAASFAVAPMYTATTVVLPPAQQQGGAAGALASLGALSSLVGSASGTRNSPDQYAALMQSASVADRIVAKFDLKHLWDEDYQVDTRRKLAKRVAITVSKKDGLIEIAVADELPSRAAAMANQYVEELRWITKTIAVSEAQQRRVFFERLLEQTRDKLGAAQSALERSGYSAGAMHAEPKAAAENYAQLHAQLTEAQVKLQVLRNGLAETSPEVSRQRELVDALTAQVSKLESQDRDPQRTSDYVSRYREFKYQETLFELFARQYESARVDESREGALVQVIDVASPPERKSSPKRLIFILVGAITGLAAAIGVLAYRERRAHRDA